MRVTIALLIMLVVVESSDRRGKAGQIPIASRGASEKVAQQGTGNVLTQDDFIINPEDMTAIVDEAVEIFKHVIQDTEPEEEQKLQHFKQLSLIIEEALKSSNNPIPRADESGKAKLIEAFVDAAENSKGPFLNEDESIPVCSGTAVAVSTEIPTTKERIDGKRSQNTVWKTLFGLEMNECVVYGIAPDLNECHVCYSVQLESRKDKEDGEETGEDYEFGHLCSSTFNVPEYCETLSSPVPSLNLFASECFTAIRKVILQLIEGHYKRQLAKVEKAQGKLVECWSIFKEGLIDLHRGRQEHKELQDCKKMKSTFSANLYEILARLPGFTDPLKSKEAMEKRNAKKAKAAKEKNLKEEIEKGLQDARDELEKAGKVLQTEIKKADKLKEGE